MTMSASIYHLTLILDSMSDDALVEVVQAMDGNGLNRMPYDSAEAHWTDGDATEWTLTAKCLTLGRRAVLWVSCDEAPDSDFTVIDAPADEALAARDYAEEIAAGL